MRLQNLKHILVFLVGCITIFAGCKKDKTVAPVLSVTDIKTDLMGTWYYNNYDVKYYDEFGNMFYDAVADNYHLKNYGPLEFFGDGSFYYTAYPNPTPTFQITTSGAVDSLLVVGMLNGGSRFQITSISKDTLILERTGSSGIVYNNISEYAHYDHSHSKSLLTRVAFQ